MLISIPAPLEPNALRDLIATSRDAYGFLEGGKHFGKVVIAID